MKFITKFSFLLFTFLTPPHFIIAQNAHPFECVHLDGDVEHPPSESNSNCFDVNDVAENCIPIFLNVTVHFFFR